MGLGVEVGVGVGVSVGVGVVMGVGVASGVKVAVGVGVGEGVAEPHATTKRSIIAVAITPARTRYPMRRSLDFCLDVGMFDRGAKHCLDS